MGRKAQKKRAIKLEKRIAKLQTKLSKLQKAQTPPKGKKKAGEIAQTMEPAVDVSTSTDSQAVREEESSEPES